MRYVRYKFKSKIHYGKIEGENIRQISCKPWDPSYKEMKDLVPLKKVSMLSPCEPSKVIGVALNYPGVSDNIYKMDEPLFFLKPSTSVIGSMEEIINPFKDLDVWGECELAIVIGKLVKKASKEEAADSILGYAVANDVSERAFQIERGGQWIKGKSFDSSCPLGPWLVTKEEVGDTQNLGIWLEINGKRFQNGNTRTMIFNVNYIMSYISCFMTLMPGDVIITGTPPGVGLGQNPPVFLKDGDKMRLGIEGLGEQSQSVISYPD